MVSSLGGLPLANPLQNPVLTGLGQYYNAIYSPLQMMAAPIQAIAMANMYGDRGMYYANQGALAGQKANQIGQGYGTDATGQTAYTLANQQGAPSAQQYLSSVAAQPGAQVGVDLSRVPLMQAQQQLAAQRQQQVANQTALTGQEAINIGGNPPIMNPAMVGNTVQGNQQTGLTPQGNSPGQMQGIQQQLGQLTQGTPQQQQSTPIYADQMQPTQLAQLAYKGSSLPPISPGPLLPGTSKLLGQLDSSPQFNPKLSDQIMLALNPDNQQFVGPDYGIAGARRGYNDILSRTGNATPAYNNFQKMLQNSVLGGEGLANIAAPNTRAASIISKNQALLDPRQAPNPQAYIGNLYNIANMQAQDYSSIIQGRYNPQVRAAAYNQFQQFIKLPGIQQALGLNQQQGSSQSSNQAPPQAQQQASVFQSPDFQSAIAAELKSRGS